MTDSLQSGQQDAPDQASEHHEHKKDTLTFRIFLGLALGFCVGLVMYYVPSEGSDLAAWVQEYLIDGVFLVGGKIFVNLLKLMIVPLVLVSLICGVIASEESKSLGRLGTKTSSSTLLPPALPSAWRCWWRKWWTRGRALT